MRRAQQTTAESRHSSITQFTSQSVLNILCQHEEIPVVDDTEHVVVRSAALLVKAYALVAQVLQKHSQNFEVKSEETHRDAQAGSLRYNNVQDLRGAYRSTRLHCLQKQIAGLFSLQSSHMGGGGRSV